MVTVQIKDKVSFAEVFKLYGQYKDDIRNNVTPKINEDKINDLVVALLEKGANPNEYNPENFDITPLLLATEHSHLKVMETLLKSQASPFKITFWGEESFYSPRSARAAFLLVNYSKSCPDWNELIMLLDVEERKIFFRMIERSIKLSTYASLLFRGYKQGQSLLSILTPLVIREIIVKTVPIDPFLRKHDIILIEKVFSSGYVPSYPPESRSFSYNKLLDKIGFLRLPNDGMEVRQVLRIEVKSMKLCKKGLFKFS